MPADDCCTRLNAAATPELAQALHGVDRPRFVQSLFRAAGWPPCRAVTGRRAFQWRRVARVSHTGVDTRVVRNDWAVGLAGRNLRDDGGETRKPPLTLGGHATRAVRGPEP